MRFGPTKGDEYTVCVMAKGAARAPDEGNLHWFESRAKGAVPRFQVDARKPGPDGDPGFELAGRNMFLAGDRRSQFQIPSQDNDEEGNKVGIEPVEASGGRKKTAASRLSARVTDRRERGQASPNRYQWVSTALCWG